MGSNPYTVIGSDFYSAYWMTLDHSLAFSLTCLTGCFEDKMEEQRMMYTAPSSLDEDWDKDNMSQKHGAI